MAEAKEDESADMDILTCSICLEIFKTPRYLPCLHTFCEACLITYVESSTVDRDNTKVIPCPICRKIFPLENETAESLKSQFSHNHLINSLLERKAIKKYEKLCHVCEMSDVTELAVSWCVVCQEALCKNCENCHRKFKMTCSHNIMFIQDMIKENKLDCIYSGVYCEKHPEKVVEIFCEDHSKPCCTVCATVEHRKCDNVLEINDAAERFNDSKDAKCLKDELIKFKVNLTKARALGEKNIEYINKRYKEFTDEIETLKAKIINHVTILAKAGGEDAEKSKQSIIQKEQARIKDATRYESTIDEWLKILNSCSKHGTSLENLIESKRIIAKKSAFDSELSRYNSYNEADLLIVKLTLNELLTSLTSIGSIGHVKCVDMKTGNIKVLFDINVGTTDNKAVSGLFFKDWIVLTNRYRGLVLLYDHEGNYLRELVSPVKPYDIAEISENEACVSGHNERELFMISIPDLTITRTISANVLCYGLAYTNGRIALGLQTGIALAKLVGNDIMEEKTIPTGGQTLYVKTVDQDQYICADGQHKVISNTEGKYIFTYFSKDLVTPRGIDTDFQGNIYICGFSSENIHQLSPEGKLIRIIKASVLKTKCPWIIRFKKHSNMFLLTSLESGKVVVGEIQ